MQLHQPEVLAEFARQQASIITFSFASLERLQTWVPFFYENILQPDYSEKGLTLPPRNELFSRTVFVADPELAVYHAYGMYRSKPSEIYSPQVLRQYARWRKQGKPVQLPKEDPLQQGGDFVINRQGLLTLAQVGRTQHERPPVSQILEALHNSH